MDYIDDLLKNINSLNYLQEHLQLTEADCKREYGVNWQHAFRSIIDNLDALPTFGGDIPVDTIGVFSWDERRLLVRIYGSWEIVGREDW